MTDPFALAEELEYRDANADTGRLCGKAAAALRSLAEENVRLKELAHDVACRGVVHALACLRTTAAITCTCGADEVFERAKNAARGIQARLCSDLAAVLDGGAVPEGAEEIVGRVGTLRKALTRIEDVNPRTHSGVLFRGIARRALKSAKKEPANG